MELGRQVKHHENGASYPPTESDVHDDLTIALPVRFVRQLSAAETLSDILTTVARWSKTVFGVDRASITLADSTSHLKLIAIEGNDAIPMDMLVPVEGTMVGRVFSQKKSEICPDFSNSTDLDCLMLSQKGLQSCLDVPLLNGSRCFGTMNIAHLEKNSFSNIDLQKLEAMAHWVAACIRIHRQMEEMTVLSETDPLTGAYNRRAFTNRFASMAKLWSPERVPLGIALIDLDHFKAINDIHGHDVGDKVLVHVSRKLLENFRKSDLVARVGGDEFCIIMSDIDKDGMMSMLDRFSGELSKSAVEHEGRFITVTASIGALLFETGVRDLEFLVGQADKAMYRAKEAGRNRIEFDHILIV